MRPFRSASLFAGLSLSGLVSVVSGASPIVDLDGDGLSDIWQIAYAAESLVADGDDDGDGASNADECRMGTDPFDAESRFAFLGLESDPAGVAIRFVGAPGQSYYVESSEDLVEWEDDAAVTASEGGPMRLVASTGEGNARFMRFRVGADQDGDGISDQEERWLGYDPLDANSGNGQASGDMARLMAAMTSGGSFSVRGRTVEGALPTQAAASRFLAQAALGSPMSEIERVAELGFEAWIDDQFTKAAGKMEPEIDARLAAELDTYNQHRRYAWWQQIMSSDDLLRQRIAVALSEIYVVSDQVIEGQAGTEGLANYYDMLLDHAFGNWRDLLRDVSLHPVMGFYLSHLQNRKADPEINRFPDENYAREIMQLFSIGLFELNVDGTRIQDAQGNDIPTYDNEDITNFARVFTGFAFGGPDNDTSVWWHFVWGEWDWDDPMKVWIEEHDTDAKTLLRGKTLPAFAEDPGRVPMDDFEDAIDNLYEHPNVGPFISYRLIQRLVTSNPSPEYVKRVAQVFNDNGQGLKGDMKAVVKAILLDVEALSARSLANDHAGRLREPFLRWVRLVKSFEAKSGDGTYQIADWSAMQDMEQSVMSSRTVFNFFLPDYQPAGEMNAAGLVGPEFQILTSTTAMSTQNYWAGAMLWGFGPWDEEHPESQLNFTFEAEVELAQAGDIDGLIDRLDLILTYGQMREETKTILKNAYQSLPDWYSDQQDVATLVRLIMLSPDFAVYR